MVVNHVRATEQRHPSRRNAQPQWENAMVQLEQKATATVPAPPAEVADTVTRRLAEAVSRNDLGDDTDRDDAIVLEHVCCYFGEKKVVDDVSLNFKRGRISALTGPSGCG